MPLIAGASSADELRYVSYRRCDGDGRERLEHDEVRAAGDSGAGREEGAARWELGVAGLVKGARSVWSCVLGTCACENRGMSSAEAPDMPE